MDRHLRTPRLILRPPQPGDEHPAHARWAADPQVLRYLGWRPHASIEQTRQQLDWEQARWLKRSAWTWLLLARAGAPPGEAALPGGPLGLVQLLPMRLDAPPHHLRLGFLLAALAQGRGLMAEAVRAVVAQAFAEPGVWRIDALCDVDNEASRRLLERLGFQCEGRLARHTLHPNIGTTPRDVWSYAMVREAPAA